MNKHPEKKDNTNLNKPSNQDAFLDETERIFRLYLDGIITIHEVDIIFQDLRREYGKK